jgi:hypothetical protein
MLIVRQTEVPVAEMCHHVKNAIQILDGSAIAVFRLIEVPALERTKMFGEMTECSGGPGIRWHR